jgi:hypothetical protein
VRGGGARCSLRHAFPIVSRAVCRPPRRPAFDPATMTWTLLSAANDTRRPSARSAHGFTSAGGLLYILGGYSDNEGDGDAVGRVKLSGSGGWGVSMEWW